MALARAVYERSDGPVRLRARIRAGEITGSTAGLAPGFVQANLAILPGALADDFATYCERNPQPCPLLARTAPGDPLLPVLGAGLNLRTDLPRYREYRDGRLVAEHDDITALWRDDLVGFALGCSFSFEESLVAAGIRLRHYEEGRNLGMYRTSLANEPAGLLSGPMVVSMRPIAERDVTRAIAITERYPRLHGAPVHCGDPAAIGIADLARADFGEPGEVRAGEVPCFWASGVTPQVAIEAARPDLCLTHKPGSMLITD
jgi:uncharacterized protein YcsI (UPF0317 family)